MKKSSLWIIRMALSVQFLGVLAVPTIVLAADSPRALWMAEWLRPHSIERSIGVLKLRENKLSFSEQIGQADWELDLSRVKKVATINGGRSLLVVATNGDEYIVTIMDADLTPASAKRATALIDRALQLQSTISR